MRATTAFFGPAKRGTFLPGHGPIGPREFSLFAEATEKNFSEILLLSFATKLEMIFIF